MAVLEALLSELHDAAILIDGQGRVRYLNTTAAALTGWSLAEALNQPIERVATVTSTSGATDVRSRRMLLRTRSGVQRVVERVTSPAQEGHSVVLLLTPKDSLDVVAPIDRRAYERLAFLADASEVFASSLDYATTIASLARLVLARIGDACVIHMRTANGGMELAYTAHVDEAALPALRELYVEYPPKEDDDEGITRVLRTGRPELYPSVSDTVRATLARDEEHLRLLRTVGYTSCLIVPLVAREQTIGALSVMTTRSDRRLSASDLAVTESLARRAAVGADNARLYAEIHAQRERLSGIVASVPGVVWEAVGAPDGPGQRVHFVSDYVNQMMGYSVEEWLQTPNLWLQLVHPADRERAAQQLREKFEGTREQSSRFRWLTRDGREIWVEAWSRPIYDTNGSPIGLRGVTIDITSRVEAEQALAKAKEAAEAASRAKDEFIALLSHELRTPLTPVLIAVQTMKEDKTLSPEFLSACDLVDRNTQLEARLIDDLIDLTRLSSGKLSLVMSMVDVHFLIDGALADLRAAISMKRLKLVRAYAPRAFAVEGDARRLQQVLWHLLHNASKFTPEGGEIRVSTSVARERDGGVRIVIEDSGIGLDDALLSRMFRAFERGASQAGRVTPGLGLGLTLSRAILDLHDGYIGAANRTDRPGASFWVELNEAPAARAIRNSAPQASAVRVGKEHPRVLLVEDHEDTVILMELALRRRGYDVTAARTVAEATNVASEDDFDIVVSDIGLPDGTGIDVIRAITAARAIPAIALSGFGTEGDVARSKEAGFAEHLVKPVSIDTLHQALQRLVR